MKYFGMKNFGMRDDIEDIIIKTSMQYQMYPAAAYIYVAHAFEYAMNSIQGFEQCRRLITADEFTRLLTELAMLELGCMAADVFSDWRIKAAADIGTIIEHLIIADALFDAYAMQADGGAELIQDFNSLDIDFLEKLRYNWSVRETEI